MFCNLKSSEKADNFFYNTYLFYCSWSICRNTTKSMSDRSLRLYQSFTYCIPVDFSTVIYRTSPFIILGVMVGSILSLLVHFHGKSY